MIWFHKILIQVLNLLWMDWYPSFTTPLLFHTQILLKKLWDSIWEFSADEDSAYPIVKQPFPYSPSMTLSTTRQHSRCNKVHLCRQQFATDPSSIIPVSMTVISCHPARRWSVTNVCLQAYGICGLCYVLWSPIRSSHNITFKCNFLFSTASCICVCIVVPVDLPGL
jgi:hypothetical protein